MFDRQPIPGTIRDAALLLRSGLLTSAVLTRRCLTQISRYDDLLHAMTTVMAEQATAAAARADELFARGVDLGPLQGIPIAIKDMIDVAGVPTRAQSAQRRHSPVPTLEAEVVERLVAGGAVIIGKTTTHEFAFGSPDPSHVDPPARNPWDAERFTGGSSSGNAVAIATGMALGAIGTDTGGSVRSPAALCGIAGYKPERSAISRQGVIALAPSLDAVGVMAMDAADCAIMMQVVGEPSDQSYGTDDYAWRHASVGWIRHFHDVDVPAHPDTSAGIARVVRLLRDGGANVEEVVLPTVAEWNRAGMNILLAEAFREHEQALRSTPELFGEPLRNGLRTGAAITPDDDRQARLLQQALAGKMAALLHVHDFVITAIQRGPAPLLSDLDPWGFITQPSYGIVFNVSDLPAVAIRTGWSNGGLPLSMQIAAARGRGPELLRFAAAMERCLARLPASVSLPD